MHFNLGRKLFHGRNGTYHPFLSSLVRFAKIACLTDQYFTKEMSIPYPRPYRLKKSPLKIFSQLPILPIEDKEFENVGRK